MPIEPCGERADRWDVQTDKSCSMSSLLELQQKAGGDESGGFGSHSVGIDGGDGTSADVRWWPAAAGGCLGWWQVAAEEEMSTAEAASTMPEAVVVMEVAAAVCGGGGGAE